MNKLFLILLTIASPLFLKAEETVISGAYLPLQLGYQNPNLDLSYNVPLDPFYCNKNPSHCIEPPKLIPKFKIVQKPTKKQWALFWTFQLLDVYTTTKALNYDCVSEINPLFTEKPSGTRVILTKSIILIPALVYDDYYTKVTPKELDQSNLLYAAVIGNNFNVLNHAKQNCNKIR